MRICQIPIIMLVFTAMLSTSAQEKIGENITFTPIEHATMVIQTHETTVYVDPVGDIKRFAPLPKPDIILITHIHRDHLNASVINSVRKDSTLVIGPKQAIRQLEYGAILKNGESTTINGVRIDAVPAYNLTPERMMFHPKGRDNGYVLTIEGKRIYVSGDTEDTKEMRGLKNIDFAFVSANLPYTMTVEQAASAILEMKPKAVSPYHYRGKGGMSDVSLFEQIVGKNKDIQVRLIDWYTKPGRVVPAKQ